MANMWIELLQTDGNRIAINRSGITAMLENSESTTVFLHGNTLQIPDSFEKVMAVCGLSLSDKQESYQ